MAFCSFCGNRLMDGTRFCTNCGHPVGNVTTPQQQYIVGEQQPQQQYKPIKPDSHMLMAILTTVLFCMPLGFVAINYASKVDTYYYSDMYDAAEQASEDAKKWSIIGISISCVIFAIYLSLFIIAG